MQMRMSQKRMLKKTAEDGRERERERERRRSEVEEKKSRWTDRGTGPARVAESGHNPNAIVYSTIMLPCMFIKTKQE